MSNSWPAKFYHPSPGEVLSGYVLGSVTTPDKVAEEYHRLSPSSTPRSVLDGLVAEALQHPPCVIAFSGGRDSSALLAVAVDVARREGLPLPIAATYCYDGEPETEESYWQELVVRHVGAEHWEKLSVGSGHDVLSERARKLLLDEGLVYPAALSSKSVLHAVAEGGTVMTGEGGDEIFGRRRSTVLRSALTKPQALRSRSKAKELVLYEGPRATREAAWRRVIRRPISSALTYVKPALLDDIVGSIAAHMASEPFGNTRSLGWHLNRKVVVLHQQGLAALALRDNVATIDPFLDPRFVAAYARMVRPLGLPSRSHAMIALFSDLLPEEVLTRQSKAVFNRAMLTDRSREFASGWSGGGVDTDGVDAGALRAAWLSDWPPVQSFWLLQSAWLHDNQAAAAKVQATGHGVPSAP